MTILSRRPAPLRAAMLLILAMLSAGAARAADLPSSPTGDPAAGAQAFKQRCSICHGLSENRFGPRLGDVYGRRVATAPGFGYSDALRARTFQWSDTTLDTWLAGPKRFVPGAAMWPHVDDAKTRANLIAYLRTKPR